MNSNEMPRWLKVMLVIVAVAVLGPPTLGLLLGALGLAIGLAAVGLKVGVAVLAIYAVVLLMRKALAPSAPTVIAPPSPNASHLEVAQAQLEWEERERMAKLDRELEQAVQQKRATAATS